MPIKYKIGDLNSAPVHFGAKCRNPDFIIKMG